MQCESAQKEEKLQLLNKLIETPSPSGFEKQIQSIIKEEIKEYVEDIKEDVMGNLIGILKGGEKPKIMLMAHCDEIGLMISHISKEGFLYFLPIGIIDSHVTLGQRVVIHSRSGPVLGVIGRKPVHLLRKEEKEKVMPMRHQWIDIGAESEEDAKSMVSVGDIATFASGLQRIGNKDLIVSRGLDDKLGIFTIIETLKKLSQYDEHEAAIYMVSTVQEEVGLRGASTAAYQINADAAVIIDIGFTSDTPDTASEKQDLGCTRIGKGPIMDIGANNNPSLYKTFLDTAREKNIPIQLRAAPMPIANDAKVVQLSRKGVATISLNIPARYSHTSSEIASLRDVDYTSELLTQTLLKLNKQTIFTP